MGPVPWGDGDSTARGCQQWRASPRPGCPAHPTPGQWSPAELSSLSPWSQEVGNAAAANTAHLSPALRGQRQTAPQHLHPPRHRRPALPASPQGKLVTLVRAQSRQAAAEAPVAAIIAAPSCRLLPLQGLSSCRPLGCLESQCCRRGGVLGTCGPSPVYSSVTPGRGSTPQDGPRLSPPEPAAGSPSPAGPASAWGHLHVGPAQGPWAAVPRPLQVGSLTRR